MRLRVRAHVDSVSGYGQFTCSLVRALTGMGVKVEVVPAGKIDRSFAPIPRDIEELVITQINDEKPELLLFIPGTQTPISSTVHFTMWDTTRLEPAWVASLSQKLAVIVPNEWNMACFSAQGVQAPLRKVPLGLDVEKDWRFHSNKEKPQFVFGAGGNIFSGGTRKNLQEVVNAFLCAFPTQPDVRLSIKTWGKGSLGEVKDPRIEIIRGYLTHKQLVEWFEGIDVFVSMAAAEGWGLLQHQAMAIGRALMAQAYSGLAEFHSNESGYVLPHRLVNASGFYEGKGMWSEVEEEHVVASMRWCYEHPREVEAKGRQARLVAEKFSIRNAAEKFLVVAKEFNLL